MTGPHQAGRRALAQYLIVVAAVAVATIGTATIPALGGRGSQFLFLMAVILCSYFVGLGPALFATILGATAWVVFILPPIGSFNMGSGENVIRLLLFFAITICISVLQEKLKRAQQTVVREQRRLREAVEAGHVAVWEHDVIANTLWVSPELRDLLGVSTGEDDFFLTFGSLLAFVHPDDRNNFVAAMHGSEAHLRDFHVVHRIVRRDGSTHAVSTRGRTFATVEGRAERVIGIVVPADVPHAQAA